MDWATEEHQKGKRTIKYYQVDQKQVYADGMCIVYMMSSSKRERWTLH